MTLAKTLTISGRTVTVPVTLADRVINYFDPIKGQERYRSRVMMAVAGGYTGARRDRRATQSWTTRGADADSVLLPDLATLRDRSQDLYRNSPIATGAIKTNVGKVVGSGLKVKAKIDRAVLKMTDAEAEAWEAAAEREFRLWSESQECDAERTLNFAQIQGLTFLKALVDGDLLVSMPRIARPGSPYSLKLQLIHGARICNKDNARNTTTLSGGVAKDNNGAPTAYHVLKQHPGSIYSTGQREWEVLPAFNSRGMRQVLHIFDKVDIGQTRGVPYLAPVIETIKQMDRYTEAEIMAAVVTGMLTVFIKTPTGEPSLPGMGTAGGTASTGAASTEGLELGNGAIVGLLPGEDVSTVNPARPNSAFDPFVLAILRQIGVALELPFEVLVKHFTASYSAARAALLDAWHYFNRRRRWLVDVLCQPVYETVLTEAVAQGRLSAPGFLTDPLIRKAYLRTLWIGDSPGQINPKDEAEAALIRMETGLTTLEQETIAITGGDWEQNHTQQVKEHTARKEAGLLPAPAPSTPSTMSTPSKGGSDLEGPDQPDQPEEGDQNT